MLKRTSLLFLVATVVVGCGQAPRDEAATQAAKPLLLAPQDLLTAQPGTLAQGPVISGSLQPELRADLRAEIAGVVLDVLRDNGDEVRKGDLLVRIDPTAIREKLVSAQEAERAATVALDQAERQYKRMQSMSTQGLVAAETVETAEGKRNQMQSELASARTRVVEARQQLDKTEVRAPFDGVVGSRTVSAGDTAQVGMQLLAVLDVATMRFEGMIAADQVGKVQAGAAVRFRINGFPGREFDGQVKRVSPVANETTRQVQVLVSLPSSDVMFVAGLYAEGRIDVASREAIMLPDSALVRDGDAAFVWTLAGNALQRRAVELGDVDNRRGRYEIRSGLTEGEQVLLHPLGALKDGAAVQVGEITADAAVAPAADGNGR